MFSMLVIAPRGATLQLEVESSFIMTATVAAAANMDRLVKVSPDENGRDQPRKMSLDLNECASKKSGPRGVDAHARFAELIERVMRDTSQNWSDKENKEYSEFFSLPSSPCKALQVRHNNFAEQESTSSTATLTSEEESPASTKPLPSVVISSVTDSWPPVVTSDHHKERERSGSTFYHMSFTAPPVNHSVPSMLIPPSVNTDKQETTKHKKNKSRFSKLKGNLKRPSSSNHRPTITLLPKPSHKQWVDYEDELDAVSKPSYFRHIAKIVGTGPGAAYTVQLHKPAQGSLGIFIVQGFDEDRQNKSIFISKFYEQNTEKFYAGLLHPGDEILAVNGKSVRDRLVNEVQKLITEVDSVFLTILPFGIRNT